MVVLCKGFQPLKSFVERIIHPGKSLNVSAALEAAFSMSQPEQVPGVFRDMIEVDPKM